MMREVFTSMLVSATVAGSATTPGDAYVVVTGSARVYGTDGTFRLAIDRSGHFCFHTRTPLSEAAGHDPEASWLMDPSEVPRRVHAHERDGMLLRWWSWAGLEPPGLAVASADDPVADGATGQRTVRVGDVTGRLLLGADGRSGALETTGAGGTTETARYDGAVRVGGLVLPRRSTFRTAGHETMRLEIHEANVSKGRIACPLPGFEAASFDPAAPPEVEVRQAPTGHLLVRPLLAGVDVGWFIVDTGAATGVISPDVARRLGLVPVGTGVLVSFEGAVETRWYRPEDVRLGPLTLGAPLFMEMDLDFLTAPLGTPVAGVIGYPVLARAVVEAVPATATLRIFPPERHPFVDTRWSPLRLIDQVPVVEASFSHGTGEFRLDLGAGGGAGNVIFHSPSVRRLGLDTLLASGPTAAGAPAVPGILPWIELAGKRFEEVPVLLWKGETGTLADPRITGNIGLGLLTGFALVLDYRRERYALEIREAR